MKKIVGIFILIVYVSLSALQVISVHFCHGQLESIAFTSQKSHCCDNDHINHSSCCEDVIIEIDFDFDHIYSEELDIDSSEISQIQVLLENDNLLSEDTGINYPYRWREISPQLKLYLLKQSFLFYG